MVRLHPRLVFVLAFSFLLLLAISNAAGIMVPITDEELTQTADRIVLGTVTSVTSDWTPGMDFIWTTVTVATEQNVKGTGPDPVTVKVMGGTADGVTLEVEEAPHFEAGQRVVVFLMPYEGSDYYVHALVHGKFTIVDGVVQETGETEADFLARITSYLH